VLFRFLVCLDVDIASCSVFDCGSLTRVGVGSGSKFRALLGRLNGSSRVGGKRSFRLALVAAIDGPEVAGRGYSETIAFELNETAWGNISDPDPDADDREGGAINEDRGR